MTDLTKMTDQELALYASDGMQRAEAAAAEGARRYEGTKTGKTCRRVSRALERAHGTINDLIADDDVIMPQFGGGGK